MQDVPKTKTRPSSFPHDWIVPGEFIYGPSGRTPDLRLGPVFKDRWWRGHRAYLLRHIIAIIRRRVFKYPPLFWIRDRENLVIQWTEDGSGWTPRQINT